MSANDDLRAALRWLRVAVFFLCSAIVALGLALLFSGCVTGPEVIMPEDPEFAVVCEVEDPPEVCWSEQVTLEFEVVVFRYPWDTIG